MDFFMINLPNTLLNPYEQHLVARRSTALVYSVEQFSVVVWHFPPATWTWYPQNLIVEEAVITTLPFAMPFMSLQTYIMLPFLPITLPAAWGGSADLPWPLQFFYLLRAMRTGTVYHTEVVETPWTGTVAQWYPLFCFPFPTYFLTFAFLLWLLMKKLSWCFHDTMNFTPDRNLLEINIPLYSCQTCCYLSALQKSFTFQQCYLTVFHVQQACSYCSVISGTCQGKWSLSPHLSDLSSLWHFKTPSRINCRCQQD